MPKMKLLLWRLISGGGAMRMLMEGGQGRVPGAKESCSARHNDSQVVRRQAQTGNATAAALQEGGS
jgi:hypothetical protein